MTILTWSGFSKKQNSTKQPASAGTSHTVTLKAPTSLINPIFRLTGFNRSDNYLQFDGRYYFIDDIVQISNDVAEYHCSIDVLATYKTQIGNLSEYVTRSASASDGNIIDMMYPAKANPDTNNLLLQDLHDDFVAETEGFFVVGIVGVDAGKNASNAIQYYVFTPSQFCDLLAFMFSDTWLDQSEIDLTMETQKQLINPAQYLASCHWYPMSTPVSPAVIPNIHPVFGWWEAVDINASLLINRQGIYYDDNIALPSHPDIARGAYLNGEPYTKRTLTIYNFGTFDLPSGLMINSPSLNVAIYVDMYAGTGVLDVQCNGNHVAFITGEVGCEVPLAQIGSGLLGAISHTVGNLLTDASAPYAELLGSISNTVGIVAPEAAETINTLSGAAARITTGGAAIANGISQHFTKVNMIGGQGSNAVYQFVPVVNSIFSRPVPEDNAQHGRPLCQVKQLNTLSGYILCTGAEVDIAATQEEKDKIAAYLNSGFYYE